MDTYSPELGFSVRKKSPLLALPRELRDEIIKTVILSPPAPIPANCPVVERKDVLYRIVATANGGKDILYPQGAPEPAAAVASLLRLNRQIHDETKERIASIPVSVKHSYSIDINIVDEQYLLPRWTSVPVLTDCVEELRISIHILPSTAQSMSPRALSNGFFGFIERFTKAGPVYGTAKSSHHLSQKDRRGEPSQDSRPDRRIHVKTLMIDVLTPNDCPSEPDIGVVTNRFARIPSRRNSDHREQFVSPRYVHRVFVNCAFLLLDDSRMYASLHMERLDEVEVYIDGEKER